MSTFNPTPAELALTSNVFNLADPQKLGIVTGDTAVKVLSGANLSHVVLGEVWAIADKENHGFLTRKGVAIALRLIGYAQKGEPVNEALLNKPGPLAHIDGLAASATAGSPTPSPTPKSSPSNLGSILPPLTQQDKTKFLRLFNGCGPVNGFLSGERARDIFVKSKLPYEKLSQIWTLADTKTRGALDSTDFIIGMYLIQASMSSNSFTLPATLPSWVYDQAAQRDANAAVAIHATGGSASGFGSPLHESSQLPRQYTGSGNAVLSPSTVNPQYTGPAQTASHIHRQTPSTFPNSSPGVSSTGTPFLSIQTQTQHWDVSSETKSSSDQFFDSLDTQRRGYIEGDVAVPFMLASKLNEDDLARIWDLSDLHNDGKLTRDGFAVAMHLINSRLTGGEIPAALPPSLVPPSMRQSQFSMESGATGEAPLDLLGDDTPPASAVLPQPVSGSAPGLPAPNITQGAFQNALPPSRQHSAFLPAVNKDLLGDDDDEPSKSIAVPDDSAEIGNLQNQVASTTRSHSTTRAERISVEQTVNQQASHLSQLQTQLSAAKASYETESRLLGALRERLATQRTEIQKTQEELIRAESNLSATKVEKAEVEGFLLRDKEEIRDLQRKMKEVADETDGRKSAIEKVKKDARQQKGLLAIAKKQLATAEAERSKVSKELEASQREFDSVQKEKVDLDGRIATIEVSKPSSVSVDTAEADRIASPAPSAFAAGIPLPETPQPVTPQPPALRQSTNPFERLAKASASADATVIIPFPALLPLGEKKVSENTAITSDPFGVSTPTPGPSMDMSTVSVPPSLDPEESIAISKPNANPTSSAGIESSPALAHSPTDDNVLFFAPPATEYTLDLESKSHPSQPEPTFPGSFPDTGGDGNLEPLQEVENDDSDTSDGDDEPSGTKISTGLANEHADVDITSTPVAPSKPPDIGQSSSVQPTFDDSFGGPVELSVSPEVSKISPPTSGKSSPGRSRSPDRALSTRTLSSHSISGPVDPFGASTFSQTPLEPPAGETAPPPTIETVLEPGGAQANTSNVSDFDESLGKMPNSTMDPAPAFRFDSTFDDNFDFSSVLNGNTDVIVPPPKENGFGASGSSPITPFVTFPPVSAPTSQTPAPSMTPPPTTGVSPTPFGEAFVPQAPVASPINGATPFDTAFGLGPVDQAHGKGQPPTSNGNGFPFDNGVANGGAFQETPVVANPFPPPSSPPLPPRQSSPPPPRETSPAIRPASPRQPRVSSATHRASSSPPPRASSPKLRALSGSKSSSETKPDGPSRHRLSIRFPFGRKDKAKDKEDKRAQSQAHHQHLEQQQFLSPVVDLQLPGTVTPAVEDDAEPVKQLAAMGFSRTQSIAALETHGYDVQKALNSLLGAA